MDIRDFYILGFAFFLLLVVIFCYARQKYGFFKFLLSCILGVGSLFLASYLLGLLGVTLKPNLFTTTFCAILGTPGAMLMAFLAVF